MIFRNPIQSIADHKMADGVTVGTIVVDGIAPRRPIAVSEIGTKVFQIVALGSQMVVDHVENDG